MTDVNHQQASNYNVSSILERRAAQLTLLALGGAVAIGAVTLVEQNWLPLFMLLASLPFLGACFWLAQKKQTKAASELLIWTLATLALSILWVSNGHYDSGLMGLPCILIFAAMVGSRRSFTILLIVFIANIFAMGYAQQSGLLTFNNSFNDATRPVTTAIILLISGLAVRLLINDYVNTIHNLNSENVKVRESEKAIAFLANHDNLTELPNRTLASDRFEQAVQRAARTHSDKKIALIFIDLDDFKAINDSLGHETGDRYLVAIAERLRDATRASDTVCRLGGDEFLLILEGLSDERDVSNIATVIQERVSRPVITGQHKLVCSASIGISVYPNDGERYDELVKKADIAMYRSKDLGRNTFHYYNSSMNSDALERMQLLEDLRTALKDDELYVEYQPIVLLETGKIIGAEALVRWQHPKRGLIRPDIFIPLAEKSGLIVDIGAWVLERACRDISGLQSKYFPEFRVAVNVSTIQLKRDDFKKRVKKILADVPISPNSLELEITESELLSDSPEFDESVEQLKLMGISLAIDDFGTGYSNLGYVQKIKVAKLKIDRSFVHGIEGNSDNQAIVRAVHNIADGLIMNTVAEGVENAEELLFLKELGITHGQGYLWSRPVSIKSLIRLLQDAA
ncbi:putative bifunctional diguanylate cyclase/phosphodiesterase [Marinagarivorans cellulosilyticus]|uniref:Diguanylate cyclase n=1 Tax=Marinagarivorans cellulosilyticus TaxID=2721545 RepID=A0AAN2BIN9_9GAMM|nr:EAL domain-containing protein [Marinagarivorans cellulosilyticus]BCD96108.1 diguanylate cyclase [Marinagarivorans cellulosilyticus]